MQGRISAWIKDTLGLDPANLYPSVRCGLEGAVLTAMADAHGMPLAGALRSVHRFDHQPVKATRTAVLVNGLLDCNGSVEEAVTEARRLVAQGYAALKIKVCPVWHGNLLPD